jgi:hypothetical protein
MKKLPLNPRFSQSARGVTPKLWPSYRRIMAVSALGRRAIVVARLPLKLAW